MLHLHIYGGGFFERTACNEPQDSVPVTRVTGQLPLAKSTDFPSKGEIEKNKSFYTSD